MNKKLLGIFGLIILVFAIFNTAMFSTLFTGWTTLSVSPTVTYTSNDPTLNRDAFLISISQTQQGEYATGTVFANTISNNEGTATKDITIKSHIEDYNCEYPVNIQTEKIYDYSIVDTCGKLNVLCTFGFRDNCLNRGSDYYVDSSFTQYYCIQKTAIATVGLIGDRNFVFKTTFNIDIDGLKENLILTPQKTSARSNDGHVNIAWTGNTVSGTDCPQPYNNDIGIIRYNNMWRTVDLSNLYSYTINHKTDLDTCFNNAQHEQDANVCMLNVNLKKESVLSYKNFVFQSANVVLNENPTNYGYTSDGVLILELAQLLKFPQYALIVDADTLGIVKPVGKPSIISTTPVKFTTGQTGSSIVNVKNIGDAQGSFGLVVNCDSPISYISGTQYLSLLPGETESKQLNFKGECNSDITRKCSVTVYDRNNPTIKDTRDISVSCSPQLICNIGDVRCFGEIEMKCIGGTSWQDTGTDNCGKIEEICQIDADCDDGNWLTLDKCAGTTIAGIDTGLNKQCKHTDMTFVVIVLLLLFIVGLISIIAKKRGK